MLRDLISFFFCLFLFRLFRQQPGMDIESVSARAESGEYLFTFLTVPLFSLFHLA